MSKKTMLAVAIVAALMAAVITKALLDGRGDYTSSYLKPIAIILSEGG